MSEWNVAIHRTYGGNAEFRPLQSEQRQVAELEAMIASYSGPSNKALAQEIYNAGFRKVEQ